MARFPIRPQSPNPRIKIDEDNTPAVYGDLQYLYDYVMQNGGGGGGQPGPPGPAGPAGAPGPVGMTWKGGWSNTVNYVERDVVIYNGSGYICVANIAASNNNPTVAVASWDLLVSQGSQGIQGVQGIQGAAGPVGPTGLNWQGTWNPSTSYVADDAVGYNGASYFCIQNIAGNIANQNPFLDTTNWALLAAQGAQGPQGVQGPQGAQGLQGNPGPQGPSGTSNVPIGNSVFVSKIGSDATGTRDNMSLPFVTIQGALAAAQTGDTIFVFPGDYELTDQLVLKNDIHFEFLGEGLVQLVLGVNKNIFEDSGASAVNCKINAPGWTFEGRNTTVSQTDNGIIKLTKASTVVFNAYKLLAQKNCVRLGTGLLSSLTIPKLSLTAHTIECTQSNLYGPIYATSARLDIKATDVLNANSVNEYDAIFTMRYCPYISIKANRAINAGIEGQVIYIPASNPGDVSYIDIDYMKSGTGWTVWVEGPDETVKSFITSKYIESKGDCVIVSTNVDLTITGATIYNDRLPGAPPQFGPIDGILHAEFGGKLTAVSCILRKGPTTIGPDVRTTGGKLYLVNTTYNKESYYILPSSTGEIFNWNGTDYFQYKEISLSSAEISNLYSTPLTVLPALNTLPPYGINYYDIEKIIIEVKNYDPNVTPQMTGDFELMLDQARFATVSRDLVEGNRTGYVSINPSPNLIFSNVPMYQPTVSVSAIPSNRSLIFQAQNSNPIDVGTLTMKIKIWYKVSLF